LQIFVVLIKPLGKQKIEQTLQEIQIKNRLKSFNFDKFLYSFLNQHIPTN